MKKESKENLRISVFYEEKVDDNWEEGFMYLNLGHHKYSHEDIEKEINRVLTRIYGEENYTITKFFKSTGDK